MTTRHQDLTGRASLLLVFGLALAAMTWARPASAICLLNHCTDDDHCNDCAGGRTTCLIAEGRCVACDPNQPIGQQGCPASEECSPYGICTPMGLTCPTDGNGDPTVVCNQNSDCLACSPMDQVCNVADHTCQACTQTNTQHCLLSDICLDGDCSPRCPQSCADHNDCAQCGGSGNEAHACFEGICAACADTWPCPAGLQCDHGVCTPACGIPGPTPGDCLIAEDCHYCGDSGDYGTWQCQKPANANPADHGACGPPAADCAELGQSVTVLPAPWGQASPGCSGDPDCSAAELQYDVGTMIHGILGGSELDLGATTLHICTAAENASGAWAYPLDECALVPIAEAVDCGVCAPCSTDADCAPISIDTLVPGLFCDDPQALLGGAVLIDLLWGDNPEHELHFFCQSVAGDAGVCTPCGNPTQRCTEGGTGGTGGAGGAAGAGGTGGSGTGGTAAGGTGTGGSGAGGGATGGSGASAPASQPVEEGDCGCRLRSTASATAASALGGLLGLGLLWARRRRRTRRH